MPRALLAIGGVEGRNLPPSRSDHEALYALEGKAAITDEGTLEAIERLRHVYGLELTAADSHKNPEPT